MKYIELLTKKKERVNIGLIPCISRKIFNAPATFILFTKIHHCIYCLSYFKKKKKSTVKENHKIKKNLLKVYMTRTLKSFSALPNLKLSTMTITYICVFESKSGYPHICVKGLISLSQVSLFR